MIDQTILFHNVSEAVYNEEVGGYHLLRLPNESIQKLRDTVIDDIVIRNRYKKPAGCELRFVMESDTVQLHLYCTLAGEVATICYGEVIAENISLKKGDNHLEITLPPILGELPENEKLGRFAPYVIRVSFLGVSENDLYFVAKKGKTRCPLPAELPTQLMLSYGTSITQGYNASSQPLTYVALTAKNLKMDLINMGLGGGAFCEPEIARIICKNTNWNIATICVSVNMFNQGVSLSDYYDIIKEFLTTIITTHPTKHIFCISPFHFFGDIEGYVCPRNPQDPNNYRSILEKIVEELNTPYLHYINGKTLLTDLSGVSYDFIHPSDLGMIEISKNLTMKINEILE
ncbi:MAG: SGNH/GDSL hydrolase family protein [Eubacteriales bacterium]